MCAPFLDVIFQMVFHCAVVPHCLIEIAFQTAVVRGEAEAVEIFDFIRLCMALFQRIFQHTFWHNTDCKFFFGDEKVCVMSVNIIFNNQLRHIDTAGGSIVVASALTDIHFKDNVAASALVILDIKMADACKINFFEKILKLAAYVPVAGVCDGIVVANQFRRAVVHENLTAGDGNNFVAAVDVGAVYKHGIIAAFNVFLNDKCIVKAGSLDCL